MTPPDPIDGRNFGNSAELGAALARHESWLRTVIFGRLGDRHAVEDILQEVAIAACRHLESAVPWQCQSAWLYRVAIRQVMLYRRRLAREGNKHRAVASRTDPANTGHLEPSPLDWALAAESEDLVRAALTRLPDRDRQILLLKYTEDWSCRDIAEHLGIRVTTVETRLFRARARLRKELGGYIE